MKILLTGASGQLGTELIPLLQPLGKLLPVDIDCSSCVADNCQSLDMTDAGALETLLNRWHPDLIVNAAAYTAVDQAEENAPLAFDVNAQAPGRMGRWASRNNAFLFHYSTDYVFNGRSSTPYLERDEPDPLSVYGESKLAGERAIAASNCRHLVIRTSWVYSSHGHNFVLSMLRLARQGLKLNVVNDQVGCPTWARNLASVTAQLLRTDAVFEGGFNNGLIHYSDADRVSWYDFAKMVFELGVKLGKLEAVPDLNSVDSSQFPQLATRPAWSVLDTSVARSHGIVPASLSASLERCIGELNVDNT